MSKPIPVVDLFAGPGGLGEGFSSYRDGSARRPYRIALSIEKDAVAHQTLELRAFFRQFADTRIPNTYYRFLRGEINRDELFGAHPKEAERAHAEAWEAELGRTPLSTIRERIKKSLPSRQPWVLIGGPPCQAYSLAGRSRNKGVETYVPDADVKQTLYVEYLQIIADFRPAVFVMENVKGLLSATLAETRLFERIIDDLSNPLRALGRESRTALGKGKRLRYVLHALSVNSSLFPSAAEAHLVRAERHGVPQARHRVILVGVREDQDASSLRHLRETSPVRSMDVLEGLPRLRSGLHSDDPDEWLKLLRSAHHSRWLSAIRGNGTKDVATHVSQVLEKLVLPKKGRGDEFVECDCTVDYQKSWFLDHRIGGVCNHSTRSHMATDLHRYLFVSAFGAVRERSPQLKDFPRTLLPKHVNVDFAVALGGYFADRFRVQLADKPATTVTSHISKDGHYYIHYDPSQCRSLTVREAGRLQTFPDNYFFCGGRTSQYVQVGNAVPPLLARQIADVVYDLF